MGNSCKKGNEELLNKINQYITEFQQDGGFDKLAEKYLSELKQVFEELNIPFLLIQNEK